MSDNEAIIGNLTTIIMFVFATFGGGAIVEVLGGTSQASIVIGAVIGLIYSIINAYFPNKLSILNNNKEPIEDIADAISCDGNCDCDLENFEDFEFEEDDDGC